MTGTKTASSRQLFGRPLTSRASRRGRGRGWGEAAWSSAGILGLLAAWWLATAVFGAGQRGALASPVAVVERLIALLHEPLAGQTLLGHAIDSLSRWGAGFLAAAIIGVLLGYVFAWYPMVRAVLLPPFEILRYIPPFAWIPLAILWFGPGFTAEAFVVFIAVFPPCVLNAELGVRGVDPILIRASKVLGANRFTTLIRTVIPTSGPATVTGLRIGIGNGWMALMGAELIVGRSGLGYVILAGERSSNAATVIAGMVTIGALGAAMDLTMRRLSAPFTRWRKGLEV